MQLNFSNPNINNWVALLVFEIDINLLYTESGPIYVNLAVNFILLVDAQVPRSLISRVTCVAS